MAPIKKLDDLADSDKYRKFLKTELSSLKNGDPIFISKEDFTFNLKGNDFDSRAVLFGSKAATSAANLKKQGIDWREGTCVVLPNGIGVDGIASSIIKAGQRTLQKLTPGVKLKPASAAEATGGASDSTNDRNGRAKADRAKKTATRELKAFLATNPKNKSELSRAYKVAQEAEKKGDWAAAEQGFAAVSKLIETTKKPSQRAARQPGNDGDRAAYDRKRKPIVADLRSVLASKPSNAARIRKLVDGLKKFEAANQLDKAEAVLDALANELEVAVADESAPTQAAAADEVESDAESETGLPILLDYAKQLRVEFRRLPKNRDAAEPLFVGRQPRAYDHKGQQVGLHPIIAGLRSVKHAKAMKKEGERLLEGKAWVQGKTVFADGIPPGFIKRAAKDLKRLKLGFQLVLAIAEEEDPLDSILEPEDEVVEEPERDLTSYRKFLRAQLRKLPQSPDTRAAFYVSRKPVAFDADGRPYEIATIFVGKKSVPQVKAFKREGTQFLEGECYVQSGEVLVDGIPGGVLRKAAKSLKALKLGFTISELSIDADPVDASAAESDLDEADLDQAETGRAPSSLEIRKAVLAFRSNVVPAARTDANSLSTQIRRLPGEDDLAIALDERLGAVISEVDDATDLAMSAAQAQSLDDLANARNRLEQIRSSVSSDPLLQHCDSSPFGVRLRQPMVDGLGTILSAMA